MNKRSRRRSSPVRVFVLLAAIGFVLYLNQVVVPNAPRLFMPTPTPTRSPESFLNEADKLFKDGKLLPAIEAYKQAIQVDPSNKNIYVNMARVQVFAGQYQDALTSAERSLVGNDEFSMGHAVRGWALNFLEQYTDAEIEVSRALELDPTNALAHAYYAEVLINRNEYGDLDKARAESKLALDLAPSMLETLRARAYVLFNTGNYQESIDTYAAAININKNIPDLWIYTGYNYRALEGTDADATNKAIRAFLQAKTLNPKDPLPDVELSRTYLAVGEYEKAIQYAENAVKADPENPFRYGNLGMMLYKKGDYNKAAENLGLAVRGGTSADGAVVKGQPLDKGWMAQYYVFYGFALARSEPSRCDLAVPVFQALMVTVPDDEISVENAKAGLDECSGVRPTQTPEP